VLPAAAHPQPPASLPKHTTPISAVAIPSSCYPIVPLKNDAMLSRRTQQNCKETRHAKSA
jgi:hypothetical protein